MNNRERIINTVLCKPVDRLPVLCDFGPWEETYNRWKNEGWLETYADWDKPLNLDDGVYKLNFVNLLFDPWFDEVIIEQKENSIIRTNRLGVTEEVLVGQSSIPRHVKFPVTCIEDWNTIKNNRLGLDFGTRLPNDFVDLINNAKKSGKVIRIGKYPYGLFGTIRELMGVEEFLCAFYLDPELIKTIMKDLTDLWLSIYEHVQQYIQIDWIHIWEDMSGNTGSLISPELVREFMLPHYKRIGEFAKENNIPIFSIDTDGDCNELLPIFIEAGVNLVFPFEVNAGSDVVKIKELYPNLCIMGGIDKAKIGKGKSEIDTELKRVSPLFKGTGYIPMLDHGVPPDVSYDDFKYFYVKVREMCNDR